MEIVIERGTGRGVGEGMRKGERESQAALPNGPDHTPQINVEYPSLKRYFIFE